MDRKETASSPLPALDYGSQPSLQKSALNWLGYTLTGAFVLTTLAMWLPSLHNDAPFFPFWVVSAVVATPIAGLIWWTGGSDLRRSSHSKAIVLLWAFSTLFGGWATYSWLTGVDPHVIAANRNYCVIHLRTLGYVLSEYAENHQSRYPSSLLELATVSVPPAKTEIFTCPGVTSRYLPPPTTQSLIQQLSAGGTADYVYRGAGLTTSSPPKAILVHDQLLNHTHDTGTQEIHVVYVDGTSAWIPLKQARKVIAELDAGHNPPRPEMIN